jgi:ATP-binding cassette subfamily F protein 3
MDEPTNHLDIDSKESLEDALIDYTGTLFVISHDRYFLNKVTDKILELTNEGLEEYLGNYDYYIEKKNAIIDVEENKPTKTKTQLKNEQKKQKEKIRNEKKKKKKIKEIEKQISDYEKQLNQLEYDMCLPEIYSDPGKSTENIKQSKIINEKLEYLYNEWEMLLSD